jgi:RNA polymerase sigma factor (sigma-70 family)
MIDETQIGGSGGRFPSTRRSAIVAGCSAEGEERRQALDKIVAAYWKPVYRFIRYKWRSSDDEAKDLTQAFFAAALEKELLKTYDPQKGSFRTFVRSCVQHFVINESKYVTRLKRGGTSTSVPLENADEPAGQSLDDFFEKEWIRNLFSLAVTDLRELCAERGKHLHFTLFECYDLEHSDLSYADLARKFSVSATDVTNYLAWSRREFRRLVLQRIRDITIDDAEFRREARLLLGAGFDC